MKKQFLIIGIILLLVTVGLSGCNQINSSYAIEKNKFVGTWIYLVPTGEGTNYTFTYYFFSNGTFIFNRPNGVTNGTFDIIDGNLWLTTSANGNKDYGEYSYEFSENNTKLAIEGNTYTRQ